MVTTLTIVYQDAHARKLNIRALQKHSLTLNVRLRRTSNRLAGLRLSLFARTRGLRRLSGLNEPCSIATAARVGRADHQSMLLRCAE